MAQLAEQLICNQQVGGSSPSTSSSYKYRKLNMGEFPSGQRGQTVNLLAMPSVVRIHLPPPKSTCFSQVLFSMPRICNSILRVLQNHVMPVPPKSTCFPQVLFFYAVKMQFNLARVAKSCYTGAVYITRLSGRGLTVTRISAAASFALYHCVLCPPGRFPCNELCEYCF